MLIIALDYEYSPAAELTCTKDARTMYRMAGRAGVDDVTILTDKATVVRSQKEGENWLHFLGICLHLGVSCAGPFACI